MPRLGSWSPGGRYSGLMALASQVVGYARKTLVCKQLTYKTKAKVDSSG